MIWELSRHSEHGGRGNPPLGWDVERLMKPRVAAIGVFSFVLLAAACTGESPADSETSIVLQPDGSVVRQDDANVVEPETVEPRSFAGTDPAPEFPEGLDWLNVARPIELADLRGKVVLLDFWTYGCINCIHIIPDLKRLELQYPDELVIIGVHSAKFSNEGETDNIRSIVARYDIEHPVVNDKDFLVWQLWGTRAWPTLVLIDPDGNIVGGHSGEGIYGIFQPVIDSIVEEFDSAGRLDRTPLRLVLEKDAIPDSVLSFPGKVLADESGGRLFVADTYHHRILVTDLATGEVLDVVGSGAPGYADGAFELSQFDQPQGMALSSDGRILYVADTGSHSIRSLDLVNRDVSTLLGTGDQALSYPPLPGLGPDLAISSPWDVALDGTTLYIAMAGSHQIWSLNLENSAARWYVGTGRESTANGLRLEAELAQPSALVVLPNGSIAFADSESSSIRYAESGDGGVTGVLAGTDVDLFDFGDVDGAGTAARLQHPLGIEYAEGALWVADTYNSKIKRLDPETGVIESWSGGDQGWADGSGSGASFSEPGGLSYAGGLLYVADTNNHAIRIIDLSTGDVTTRILYGIEHFPSVIDDGIGVVHFGDLTVAPGAGAIVLDVKLPPGYKINDVAPFSMSWDTVGVALDEGNRSIVSPQFPLTLVANLAAGSVAADLTIYYCTTDAEALCFIERVRLEANIIVEAGASSTIELQHAIADPGL